MAVVLVLLALLLAFLGYQIYRAQKGEGGASNQAGSKDMVWIQSIYGWGDADGQQLIRPNTVAVDADGLIWTNSTQPCRGRVQSGRYVRPHSREPAVQARFWRRRVTETTCR